MKPNLVFTNFLCQENYLNYQPLSDGKSDIGTRRMNLIARAAESIATGDIVNVQIRRYRQWQLFQMGSLASCIIPYALYYLLFNLMQIKLLLFFWIFFYRFFLFPGHLYFMGIDRLWNRYPFFIFHFSRSGYILFVWWKWTLFAGRAKLQPIWWMVRKEFNNGKKHKAFAGSSCPCSCFSGLQLR